jgi:hypothetical protein
MKRGLRTSRTTVSRRWRRRRRRRTEDRSGSRRSSGPLPTGGGRFRTNAATRFCNRCPAKRVRQEVDLGFWGVFADQRCVSWKPTGQRASPTSTRIRGHTARGGADRAMRCSLESPAKPAYSAVRGLRDERVDKRRAGTTTSPAGSSERNVPESSSTSTSRSRVGSLLAAAGGSTASTVDVGVASRRGSATTSSMRRSTIAPGWPTPRSCPTSARRPPRPS